MTLLLGDAVIIRMLAVLAVLPLAAPAYAGWRGAEWGMTAEQVRDAMNGEAPLKKSPRDDTEAKVANVGEYVWEKNRFRSLYYYDTDGLLSVTLNWKARPKEEQCRALLEHLVATYGQPLRVSDQMLFKNIIWHDRNQQNRVRLMVSLPAGICTLYYERLSEYEAHDLANPGVKVDPPKRVN
jgi:hypothetical protein